MRLPFLKILFLLLVSLQLPGLVFSAAPANDAFASAVVLSGTFDNANADTTDATRESGEPGQTGHFTLWYKWTAPFDGRATFNLEPNLGSNFSDGRVTVWQGTAIHNLNRVAQESEDQGTILVPSIPVKKGTAFYFCVGHPTNSTLEQGPFSVNVLLDRTTDLDGKNLQKATSHNDLVSKVVALGGGNATGITYALDAVVREPGEPARNPNYSSWWKWKAPYDGKLTLSLAGSELGSNLNKARSLVVYDSPFFSKMKERGPIGYSGTTKGLPDDLKVDVKKDRTYYIAAGVGTFNTSTKKLVGGTTPSDMPNRVLTLTHKRAKAQIRIVRPKGTTGYTLSAIGKISYPDQVVKAKWVISGRSYWQSTNRVRNQITRKLRARGAPSSELRRLAVKAYIYGPGGKLIDSDTKYTKSRYLNYR